MKGFLNKDTILYLVIMVIVIVFGISNIAPKVNILFATYKNIADVKARIEFSTEQIQKQNKKNQQNQIDQQNQLEKMNNQAKTLPVKIFKSQYSDISIENASIELVDELVAMLKVTNNTVQEISYESVSKEGLPSNFNKLKLKFNIQSTYLSLQDLLKSIYTWEYLAEINKLSIKPDPVNRNILHIDMELNLFVEG